MDGAVSSSRIEQLVDKLILLANSITADSACLLCSVKMLSLGFEGR
jgi:hypothetical protein